MEIEQNLRPPYVTFERRAVENRAESIVKGYYVTSDEDFVIVHPQGGRATYEKPVREWLAAVEKTSSDDPLRMPPPWVLHFKAAYQAWKSGEELPETGTPIKGWPVLSPAQQQAVIHANIRTVEDLATATEEGLTAIGMGARALKQRAAEWLNARGNSVDKVSAELQALKVSLAAKDEQIEKLIKQNQDLRAALPVPAKV